MKWIDILPGEVPEALREVVGGHPLVVETMVRRGMQTREEALGFLNPQFYSPCPADEIPDLNLAADRLHRAIQQAERIGVWGDFDADGQTATSLLVGGLRQLGADVRYHIPVRAKESHGVNSVHLEQFLAEDIGVLLTCDTGVGAHAAADLCRQRGVDMLITDHHSLPENLPNALAVVNPQRLATGHPLGTLSGSGCAYKLLEQLFQISNHAGDEQEYIDLATVGMVADLALLVGDARYLTQRGLQRLREQIRPAFQTMLELAEVKQSSLTEELIGFTIAPRLNAIGRLQDANGMVEFLLSQDSGKIRSVALELEGLNSKRKLLSDQVFQAAQAQIRRDPTLLDGHVLVLSSPSWPAGVIGIAASRLVEKYNRPTLLISVPPGEPGRASARSIEGINITQALTAHQQYLLGYGGHPMAAGFSIQAEKIPELRRALNRTIQSMMSESNIENELQISAHLPLSEITLDFTEELERLAPFGPGNPTPVLASHNLSLVKHSLIGKTKEHALLQVEEEGGTRQEVIWWQGADMEPPEGRFDLAYTVRSTDYRGQDEIQIEYVAARPHDVEIIKIPKRKIEVIDHRKVDDPAEILRSLDPDLTMIWCEGENIPSLPFANRYQLQPATNLVIWSIPPSLQVLQSAIDKVTPQRVILLATDPGSQTARSFTLRLSGLVKEVINHRSGTCTLFDLAAATAQSEAAVVSGLRWMEARGNINLQMMQSGYITLSIEGTKNIERIAKHESEMKYHLTETQSFRNYYLRADSTAILREDKDSPHKIG